MREGMRIEILAASWLVLACGSSSTGHQAPTSRAQKPAAEPVRCNPGPATPQGPVAWFKDSYADAQRCARARGVPLVIDFWAPWCHTCLSMKHYVLVDPSLQPLANRFVWLAIDTDREANADVLEQFPVSVWPTFYVVSPDRSEVQARHLGSASIRQFRRLLKRGEDGHSDSVRTNAGSVLPAAVGKVRDGDRAAAAGDLTSAATAYRAALAATPPAWERRPEVLVSLIGTLYGRQAWTQCVDLAETELAHTGDTASAADFAYYANVCANKLPEGPRVQTLRRNLIDRVDKLIGNQNAPLSADDRSDAMRILRGLYEHVGNIKLARQLAVRQRALLDAETRRAPDAHAAMTYNWPRAEVYTYLGVASELIPDLKTSVAALPQEYDPPYRLAWIYLTLERYDEALHSARLAAKRVYGPRKGRVLWLIADIHGARGDKDQERRVRAAVVAHYESLPASQAQPHLLDSARKAASATR